MRLSSLIILLSILFPATLFAAQTAFVIREAIAYQKPRASATIGFTLKAGQTVEVLDRKGGWKQVRGAESQSLGWVRSYLVREHTQYSTSPVESKQDEGGFLSGLVNLSRKVTGFFSTPSAATNQTVATIGIRGRAAPSSTPPVVPPKIWLSPQLIIESKGDESQLKQLQTYASNQKASRKFAAEADLRARSLALLGGS